MSNKQTYLHFNALHALVTGYTPSGTIRCARIPALTLPSFSLTGDRAFTFSVTVCMKNIQSGTLFSQGDTFVAGIRNGLLYIAAPNWCAVRFLETQFTRLVVDCWYTIAISYDTHILRVYLNGELKGEYTRLPAQGRPSRSEYRIGDGLEAYFQNFMLFGEALAEKEIKKLAFNVNDKQSQCILSDPSATSKSDLGREIDIDEGVGKKDLLNSNIDELSPDRSDIFEPAISQQISPALSQNEKSEDGLLWFDSSNGDKMIHSSVQMSHPENYILWFDFENESEAEPPTVSERIACPDNSLLWFDFNNEGLQDLSPYNVKLVTKNSAQISEVYPVRQFQMNIRNNFPNVEEKIDHLFKTPEAVSLMGCIGSRVYRVGTTLVSTGYDFISGMISLNSSYSVMLDVDGRIAIIWEKEEINNITDK